MNKPGMSPRILVTGASGFIGRNVLAPLVASGAEVHAAGRNRPASEAAVWHRCDLLDPAARAQLVDDVRPDTLVHVAWIVEHGKFWTSPENIDWVAASLDLFRRCADAGLSRFVGVGTCFEYARQTDADCDESVTPTGPDTLYGVTKDSLRRVVESFAVQNGLSWAWGRIFLLYGPGETATRLVPQVARRLIAGEPVPIASSFRARDFIDSRDAGAAVAALALSSVEGPVNIGTGRASSVREVALILADLAGRSDLLNIGAYPERDEPERIVAKIDRLTREVGFTDIRPLEQGLAEALESWRETAAGAAPREGVR